ncbi:MAG: hypothetical protein MMC33_005989 [Icmadophila ericetorum]|nr:hypothetical protein [Icmadophila ericetorum]
MATPLASRHTVLQAATIDLPTMTNKSTIFTSPRNHGDYYERSKYKERKRPRVEQEEEEEEAAENGSEEVNLAMAKPIRMESKEVGVSEGKEKLEAQETGDVVMVIKKDHEN